MDTLWPSEAADLLDRAAAHLRARRVRESLELYERALSLGVDPLAIGGERWKAHMLLGEFEAAWAVSDHVLSAMEPDEFNPTDRPFHQRPVWDGATFDGQAVLVRCYHGLGDIVQFARYLPLVAERASRLWVQAPDGVQALLAGLPGVEGVVPLSDEAPMPAFSVQAELMELPFAFRTTLATAPGGVPYLSTETTRIAAQAAKLPQGGPRGDRLRVGLAWAAGAWDGGHRSLPRHLVRRLMDVPGVDWVCLQRGAPLDDAESLPFCDKPPRTTDLRDTAAMIQTLDLVLSVDTVVAHLAGALGKPVWTFLHHEADWRWLLHRDDSPWYPTMRLFRQPSRGDWNSVTEHARVALAEA
ncbi:glycosyltransferase family 9 protein [Azospirillum sp. sgz302134]